MASPTSTTRVGWIGLGNMGMGMASNIQKHISSITDHAPLKVYNRTASRCKPVEDLGAVRCDSVEQLVEESDVIFLSLSDDSALKSVLALLTTPPPRASTTESARPPSTPPCMGKTVIDTTTVHPDTTKTVSSELARNGAQFAAMPVFGPAPVAAAGQLIAAFAGPDAVYEKVRGYLQGVIAREVMRVGKEGEKAVLLKTTSNLLTATITQAIAEAHVFASLSGVPSSILERLIELNLGPYAHLTSQRMTSGVYCPAPGTAPWSDLSLALKDVGHGIDTAERRGMKLAAGQAAMSGLRAAEKWSEENGGRRLDSSSLFGAARVENGLEFETEGVKERDGKLGP